MYQLTPSPITILRISDNAYIPTDPANSDYIAYLKWIEEGNVPTPADEPN
jgi:hypothetical protein